MKESIRKQRIKSHKKLPLKRALLSSRLRCQQQGLLQTTAILDVGWPPRYPHKVLYAWEAWVPCASKLPKLEKMMKKTRKQILLVCFFEVSTVLLEKTRMEAALFVFILHRPFTQIKLQNEQPTLHFILNKMDKIGGLLGCAWLSTWGCSWQPAGRPHKGLLAAPY